MANQSFRKVQILTLGTTGDVLPFIALALKLKKLNYDVAITTGINYENLVKSYNIDYSSYSIDINQMMQSKEIQSLLSKNPFNYMKVIKEYVKPIFEKVYEETYQSAKSTDVILAHPKCMNASYIAEKFNKPFIVCSTIPMYPPTKEFPFVTVKARTLGPLNSLSYILFQMQKVFFLSSINKWRKNVLGLPPVKVFSNPLSINGRPVPGMYCYSKHLLPKPAEWGDNINVTGFWFLDQETCWQPPEDLINFLNKGSTPLYAGFGSMIGKDPQRLTKEVIEGVRRSGQRCILATGWGGISRVDVPENIYVTDYIPHDWLFPKVMAVIHHGGAGTTAAGLRYGRPTIICPFMVDQFFWGHRVYEKGVGPEPLPQKNLTADKLASAINVVVHDKQIRENAKIIGEKINNEKGSEVAARLIDEYIQGF